MLLKNTNAAYEYVGRRGLIASEMSEKYRQIKEVGQGSYGKVFKGYHVDAPQKHFGLKKIFNGSPGEGVRLIASNVGYS